MSVDRNAADPLRLRRNQQRGRAGGLTAGVTVTAPLSNTGSHIQLNLDSAGGLESSSSLLRVKLIDTSISRTASGIGVALKTNGGLQISSGLGILLNGASLSLGATGLKVTDGGIGATQLGILTTKGDLLGFSTLHARVGVGVNDTVLTADSTAATGWAWKTAASAKAQSLGTSVTTSTGVSNTTTESIFDQWYDIPANSLAVGQTVHFTFTGKYIQASGTLTLRVYIGSSNWMDFGAFTPTTTASERSWTVKGSFTVVAIGSTGSVRGEAQMIFNNQTPLIDNDTADFTVDTTAAKVLRMTAQWSVANAGNVVNQKTMNVQSFT